MIGSPLSPARRSISLATPCALKIVTAPGGTSSISSTKRAPLARSRSTTCRLCTISCRT